MSSIIRWYGGSGRTVTPKLSMKPPRSRGRGRAYRREARPRSGCAVLPVRIRRGYGAAVPGGNQRAAFPLAALSGPRVVRVVPRRHDRAVRAVSRRLAAAADGRAARRRAVVGLDRRPPRRVLRRRRSRHCAEARRGDADRAGRRGPGARIGGGRPLRHGRLREAPRVARPHRGHGARRRRRDARARVLGCLVAAYPPREHADRRRTDESERADARDENGQRHRTCRGIGGGHCSLLADGIGRARAAQLSHNALDASDLMSAAHALLREARDQRAIDVVPGTRVDADVLWKLAERLAVADRRVGRVEVAVVPSLEHGRGAARGSTGRRGQGDGCGDRGEDKGCGKLARSHVSPPWLRSSLANVLWRTKSLLRIERCANTANRDIADAYPVPLPKNREGRKNFLSIPARFRRDENVTESTHSCAWRRGTVPNPLPTRGS